MEAARKTALRRFLSFLESGGSDIGATLKCLGGLEFDAGAVVGTLGPDWVSMSGRLGSLVLED